MPPTHRAIAIGLAVMALSRSAHADPAPAESADESLDRQLFDGATTCREFVAKNEKDLALWERTQPSVPYTYPIEKTFLELHGPPADHPTLAGWPEGRYLKFAVLS